MGNDIRETFVAHDKTLAFRGVEAIDPSCLECFPYEYTGKPIMIAIDTQEFTSVCPFSGLPDFARVTITYTPNERCVELRSLKYYLLMYRDVGIWYEHLVNRMLEDLVNACQPKCMKIVIECNPRGGLATTVTATHGEP